MLALGIIKFGCSAVRALTAPMSFAVQNDVACYVGFGWQLVQYQTKITHRNPFTILS
jgi:hypothetical protein